MVSKLDFGERGLEEKTERINDYVENIENDVSEIKFFISQIYKTITVYKDKKEEFTSEIEKLNETIINLKEKEKQYKQEIEMLNKTMNEMRKREMDYYEKMKQLERKLTSDYERPSPNRNSIPIEDGQQHKQQRKAKNTKQNPVAPAPSNGQLNSPEVFYEKRPYYNDLKVSKIVNPFQNF